MRDDEPELDGAKSRWRSSRSRAELDDEEEEEEEEEEDTRSSRRYESVELRWSRSSLREDDEDTGAAVDADADVELRSRSFVR